MKWNHKGHEYDQRYNLYKQVLMRCNDTVYVFGAGKLGQEFVSILLDTKYKIAAVIDNNPCLKGEQLKGIPIISFDEFLAQYKESILIVAVSDKYQKEVCDQLSAQGLKKQEHYYNYKEFRYEILPLMELYDENRLRISVVELSLTERCTLKCKKCAHGCWNVPMNKEDYPMEKVKLSVDSLFSVVDYIEEFYLIGGETLLYRDLADAIQYVGDNYREKIGNFIITTNGTIVPDDKVLEYANASGVTFYISNYSQTIPRLTEKYEKLCGVLEDNGVMYQLSGIERKWYDYGFDYVDHGFDTKKIMDTHDRCFTKCREIRGNRFYYCIQARSVSENLSFEVSLDDYLDLTGIQGDKKKIVFEYANGYCDKGYIDMCNYCNGVESLEHLIPVAEQMEIRH